MTKDKKDRKDSSRETRNTRTKGVSSRCWFFTWNGYNEGNVKDLLDWFDRRKKMKYVFQEEKGDEGNIHLQGCFYSGSEVRFKTLQSKFIGCHWEKGRNIYACKEYCSKMKSKCGKRWSKGFDIKMRVKDPLDGKELYPWQSQIMGIIDEEPDDRVVHWYWDPIGCTGKTALAKHICLKYPQKAIYLNGCYKDIAFAVKASHEIVMWNLPRGNNKAISYKAVESIKDGIFFCGKYESGMKIMNPPHVIIFANEPPDEDMLSKDRWNIVKIEHQ